MRSRFNFVKLGGIAGVAALLILAGLGGTGVNASPLQATMAATMMGTMASGGAYPPCPPAMPAMNETMAATMSGTMAPTMMATMSPTMMATMAPTMMATMSGTMSPTMAGTMGAGDTFASSNGCPLSGTFSGPVEVPAGDPKAAGTAMLKISRPATGPGEVCYQIKVTGLSNFTAAHIHKASLGASGPVVVPLNKPDETGVVSGCVTNVDPDLITSILTDPSSYYVNVHTKTFPGGAGRAQLTAVAQ